MLRFLDDYCAWQAEQEMLAMGAQQVEELLTPAEISMELSDMDSEDAVNYSEYVHYQGYCESEE
ncbi:MAG: hypothetical protein PVI03_07460 [Candidatus Thorarchaeota archaeon]|jgi:hypothetical protein